MAIGDLARMVLTEGYLNQALLAGFVLVLIINGCVYFFYSHAKSKKILLVIAAIMAWSLLVGMVVLRNYSEKTTIALIIGFTVLVILNIVKTIKESFCKKCGKSISRKADERSYCKSCNLE